MSSSSPELTTTAPFWVLGTYSNPSSVMHWAISSSCFRFCSS